MTNAEQQIATSVLVIGTGGSGLRAAIELAERGIDVLVVGKRPKTDAHTTLAAGGINAALATMDAEDTWQQHAADTLKESYLLADPVTVQIVTEGAARVASRISSATAWPSPVRRTAESRSASSAHTPSAAPRSPATTPAWRLQRTLDQPGRTARQSRSSTRSTSPGCWSATTSSSAPTASTWRTAPATSSTPMPSSSPPAATPGSGAAPRRVATRTPATLSVWRSKPAGGSATRSSSSSTRPG